MTLSVSELAALASAVASLVALAVSIWARMTAQSKADIAELRASDDDKEKRVARLEAAIQSLPKGEAVGELRVNVAKIEGQLGVIDERLKPVARMMERMQDWLVENGK